MFKEQLNWLLDLAVPVRFGFIISPLPAVTCAYLCKSLMDNFKLLIRARHYGLIKSPYD